jgi:hypothetical protein
VDVPCTAANVWVSRSGRRLLLHAAAIREVQHTQLVCQGAEEGSRVQVIVEIVDRSLIAKRIERVVLQRGRGLLRRLCLWLGLGLRLGHRRRCLVETEIKTE